MLIGIGPKIALVPFIDITANMDAPTKAQVIRRMITTATVVAVILIALGELLRKLLHFSTGALAIAGGIVLLIIAVRMVLTDEEKQANAQIGDEDPLRIAVFPLAVPYLLNPVGIVVLVTASGEATSFGLFAALVGVLAVVIALDIAVFRWANRVSKHLDKSRMLVTEKVFGVLLAALAVQLLLNGLDDAGVIHLTDH